MNNLNKNNLIISGNNLQSDITLNPSAYLLPFDNLRSSLEMSLSRIVSQGHNADSRISMILSTDITMMGALVAVLSNVDANKLGVVSWIAAALVFILGVCSVALVAYASFPRGAIGKHGRAPPTKAGNATVLFFSAIANMPHKEYLATIQSRKADAFLDDLVSQCHFVAQIVDLKFRALRLSFICLLAYILPWMLAIASAIHNK
jgi:Family of unknown function (DUF5706)